MRIFYATFSILVGNEYLSNSIYLFRKSLEFLGLRDPPASASQIAGTTGADHHLSNSYRFVQTEPGFMLFY
jgi:hypothetical protein